MSHYSTEAWVLVSKDHRNSVEFARKYICITDINVNEVLAKPLFGCMEGNYIHALKLKPDNIFKRRDEDEIILGNAGVVQILKIGINVKNVAVGDICILFGNGMQDEYGYTKKTTAFDNPGSMGVFSKMIKLHHNEVIKIPCNSKFSLQQWAAFSVKYVSAWSNWDVAYKCFKSQLPEVEPRDIYVFGWGGGTTFAELTLAKLTGCNCYMLTSKEERINLLSKYGIVGIDRTKYSENELLEYIRSLTDGKGASIFIDYIGQPVYELMMKALGRQGVMATAGWKDGSMMSGSRAYECHQRHIHVFTHYAKYQEGLDAIKFAEENSWLPPITEKIYEWDDIPKTLEDYSNNQIVSWFPVFKVSEMEN